MEIGGYLSFEFEKGTELYENALHLNLGRSAIEYMLASKIYSSVYLPKWCCDSVWMPAKKTNTAISWYNIDESFLPVGIEPGTDDLVVVINYFGLLDDGTIRKLSQRYQQLLIDNSQAFYSLPQEEVSTLYSARKFFGVPDGAYLFTTNRLARDLEPDCSYQRFEYLFRRLDMGAEDGYESYKSNERAFSDCPMRLMSNSTRSVLSGVDYAAVCAQRERNWELLHRELGKRNKLKFDLAPPGPLCYPFMSNDGDTARSVLIAKKVFVPTYWSEALGRLTTLDLEYSYIKNILPLPVDQRYSSHEMSVIIQYLEEHFGEG